MASLKNTLRQRLLNFKILALFVIAAFITSYLFIAPPEEKTPERKPLYWVSHMDPNYRRDGPGKCPMGMDLIPVYEDDATGQDHDQGIVKIAAEIQNQMGVRTTRVIRDSLQQRLRSFGRIEMDKTLAAKLSPRVSGWVDMLFVTAEGESVKRGQPLYSLYSPALIAAQEKFLAAWRSKNLLNIAEIEGDLRALKMDDAAINKLKADGVPQQSVIFRAPKDGMLDMLSIAEDFYVEPGDHLLTIGSLESVWAELDVFESQSSLIKPRQALTITTPSYPGIVWHAEVDYLYPAFNKKAQSLKFRAKIDNPKMRLHPNMLIEAWVSLPNRMPALLIPRQAVIDLGEQQRVVLDLALGRFKSVAVKLGESNNDFVEVLEGLEEGDSIVTSAQFLIDSESSKTSDFLRMQPLGSSADPYPPTWVNATIKEIDLQERTLLLEHDDIEAWNMHSMTMKFNVVSGIKLDELQVDDLLRVRVADGDLLFQVIALQPIKAESM